MVPAAMPAFSGPNIALNPMGRLNRKPITRPCMAQCFIGKRLIPIPKPNNVRPAMMDTPSHGIISLEPLQAKPKQTNPKTKPLIVATINLFMKCKLKV